jgi:hypothetical protein
VHLRAATAVDRVSIDLRSAGTGAHVAAAVQRTGSSELLGAAETTVAPGLPARLEIELADDVPAGTTLRIDLVPDRPILVHAARLIPSGAEALERRTAG